MWKVPISFYLFVNFCSIYQLLCFRACLSPGEDKLSFAYDALGKKVSGGIEEDYGEPLSVGDIIGCYAVSDTSLFSELGAVMASLTPLARATVFLHRCSWTFFLQEWSFLWCGLLCWHCGAGRSHSLSSRPLQELYGQSPPGPHQSSLVSWPRRVYTTCCAL